MAGTLNPAQAQLLDEWYVEAREHNVAHGMASSRYERWDFWTTVSAGILAVFTGSVWTTDLADTGLVPSATIKWVAAGAAFLSALLLAVTQTAKWKDKAVAHAQDKVRWATVYADIDALALTAHAMPDDDETVKELDADRADAQKQEQNVTDAELERAARWLDTHRQGHYTEAKRRLAAGRP